MLSNRGGGIRYGTHKIATRLGLLDQGRLLEDKLLGVRYNNPSSLIFVHVGKCGGTSLRHAVKQSPVIAREFSRLRIVHLRKPPFYCNAHI